jgi:hypothetical protein
MTEQQHQESDTQPEKPVASASNNGQTSSEPIVLWKVPFSYIVSLKNDERIRLLTAITIAILVLLGGTLTALLILVRFFDIGKDKDGFYIRSKSSVVEPTPIVINNSSIDPSQDAGKLSGKLTPDVLRSFQKNIMDKDVFRRDWVGPEGEDIWSRDLDPCLLVTKSVSQQTRWGQLLVQVMEKPESSRSDPFHVLDTNGLKPKDLMMVANANGVDLEAPRTGWLTFIVNDAVYAVPSNDKPYPQPEECKQGYEALSAASADLRGQSDEYVIPPGSIPLLWYSDNIGTFQVIVKRKSNAEVLGRITVDSTAGFQNSGIYLKKGEKVVLLPDGRVNLAARQVYTLTGIAKAIIDYKSQEQRQN